MTFCLRPEQGAGASPGDQRSVPGGRRAGQGPKGRGGLSAGKVRGRQPGTRKREERRGQGWGQGGGEWGAGSVMQSEL